MERAGHWLNPIYALRFRSGRIGGRGSLVPPPPATSSPKTRSNEQPNVQQNISVESEPRKPPAHQA